MGLFGAATQAVRGITDKVIRNAIAYSICALCGLAILILATAAGVLALIPLVGTVYALLIVAGVYAAVILGTMIWLQRAAAPSARAHAANPPLGAAAAFGTAASGTDPVQRQMQFAQLAMIIEAVALGYSLSRKR